MSSPSPGTYDRLMGIDVVSPNDIWAVGNTDSQTLTMHWDGTQWVVVPSPSVNERSNRLMGVAAVSADDVWAVGYHGTNTGNSQTIILHWDGTQWSIVPSPNVGTFENELYDVTTIAANDVWAVGRIGSSGSRELTLTLHWDGISWSIVSNPNPTGEFTPYALYGIDALAPNDVWAVGVHRNNSWSRTLIEHWNGTEWSIVPSPNANLNGDNELHAVSILSASDIWAVGFYLDNGLSGDYRTLIMHWDGTQWSIVPSPYPGEFNNRLFGVEAVSPGDVWSVGYAGTTYSDVSSLVTRYSDPCLTPSPSATGTPPTATSTNTPTATPACTLGWSIVASPNVGSGPNQLKAVAAMTSENMWAVGYYTNGNGVEQTLVTHWDGTQWSTVPSPNTGSLNNRLAGVDVVSASDAWAVGYYRHSDGQDRPLTLRWDGSSWNVISSPAPGSINNYLYAVEALSANDVWAVGRYVDSNGGRTLTMHWDGATWIVVPSHPGGGYGGSTLLAIDAVAANDIWAVGTDQNGPYPDTLTLHWNGSQWTTVQSPSPGSQYEDLLTGVSALSSNDAWATGYNFFNGTVRTLTLHWNGTTWSVVSSPNFGSGRNALYGATATESGEVWAVGEYVTSSPNVTQTLVLRWNGANWGITSSPNAGSLNNTLYGAAAVPGEVWTVGYYANGDNIPRTLVERYRAVCNTPVPTSTPTGTLPPTFTGSPTSTATRTNTAGPTNTTGPTNTPTIVPTNTATAVSTSTRTNTPTVTVTAIATACSLEFDDVAPGSTFYEFVRCLACRGIISGYSDGTFRPNNLVTRGQLAKIVSNTAGFAEDPDPQIFEDVPPANTFYQWINRLTRRGYMSGYVCGSAGEPCVNGDRPYFRPVANATRGQTSKIVANAAQYIEEPTEQTFEDVPSTHTFYKEIQRLASRNIMGGYPCGGPNEPCLSNKPYFRPSNDVTRGQSAKIVANTFYPGCQTP